MTNLNQHIIVCNGARVKKSRSKTYHDLEYRTGYPNRNLTISLSKYVSSVYHLPDRIKDLLEIAGYVFGADRKTSRGEPDSVEYHSWSRSFQFYIKVRDIEFWNNSETKKALSEALCFMTGDYKYEFIFQKAEEELPADLFDNSAITLDTSKDISIVLFSGGLDSLAGVIDRLETTKDELCLVSHQSGQPSTTKTQESLNTAIEYHYPQRSKHYKFRCGLTGKHSVDENQRTRAFLFSAIAYAIANAYSKDSIYFYENGITSLNFPKTQDMMNARASRTTHPKTLYLLEQLYGLISNKPFRIEHPYLFKTKAEVIKIMGKHGRQSLIDSSVSCSKTFLTSKIFTHCGYCSQCIDRKFAMYASEMEEFDESGIYEFNLEKDEIEDNLKKKVIVDYIRLADRFNTLNLNSFYYEMLNELAEVEPYIEEADEIKRIEKIYNLCSNHAGDVRHAIQRMRLKHDDIFAPPKENSFFNTIISSREYKKESHSLLVQTVCDHLSNAIPQAFHHEKPKNENSFNDMVEAILNDRKRQYEREFGTGCFALAKTYVDHKLGSNSLLIESKYIRDGNTPSLITDGIGADLYKYPKGKFKLFVVYDPHRKIRDDSKFCNDFEKDNLCKIHIVR